MMGLLALFIVVISAVPTPDGETDPVEVIVKGEPNDEPLDIGNIVDIKLKDHSDDEIVAASLLHPLTAVGVAEAAAEDSVAIAPVVLTEPFVLEVGVPEPVALSQPVLPEVVSPIIPKPLTHSEPVVAIPLPVPSTLIQAVSEPVANEAVIPRSMIDSLASENAPQAIGKQAAQSPSEDHQLLNKDNNVLSVTLSGPEAGLWSTLQSWINTIVGYFTEYGQSTQQII